MTCGVVRAEVVCGARYPEVKIEMLTLFSSMIEIDTTFAVWDRVTLLAWTLERQGRRIPLTDVIIAACALETDVPIITHDAHFNIIPGPTILTQLP